MFENILNVQNFSEFLKCLRTVQNVRFLTFFGIDLESKVSLVKCSVLTIFFYFEINFKDIILFKILKHFSRKFYSFHGSIVW